MLQLSAVCWALWNQCQKAGDVIAKHCLACLEMVHTLALLDLLLCSKDISLLCWWTLHEIPSSGYSWPSLTEGKLRVGKAKLTFYTQNQQNFYESVCPWKAKTQQAQEPSLMSQLCSVFPVEVGKPVKKTWLLQFLLCLLLFFFFSFWGLM